MRNAEEFSSHQSDRTQVLPTLPRPGAEAGRVRYAQGGGMPRVESPYERSREANDHHGNAEDASAAGDGTYRWELGLPWSAEFPVARRRNDVWVLVCGGIAAAAAFAAAFAASGGVAGQAATPGSTVPAVVSQACPSANAAP